MQTAGHSLGITGGHCDENGFKPGLFDRRAGPGACRGPLPDQVRRRRDQDLCDRGRIVRR
jgi:hypothetical protein